MTPKEAISYLECFEDWNKDDLWLPYDTMKEFVEWCAESVKEIQQYREIGTVEECREAVEKQRPMKVTDIHVDEYFCPACGSENNNGDIGCPGDHYCPVCGQAIWWENLEGIK